MTTNGGNGHILTESEFAAYVEQQLGAMEGVEILHRHGLELTLRVRGVNLRIGLENLYNVYRSNPEQREAVLQTLLKMAQGFNPDRSASSFADLRERIFPMLKPIMLLATVRERKVPMLVYRPFLADLIITYVIDEAESVVFINEDHLERWDTTEHEVHTQALANLHNRTRTSVDYATAGTGAQRLFIFNSQDGYDATRILLPDILDQWRRQIPGNLVIGIPNRDFLIAFSDADRTVLANVAQQVQADSVQRAYGLTDRLFTLINGEIREYDWD